LPVAYCRLPFAYCHLPIASWQKKNLYLCGEKTAVRFPVKSKKPAYCAGMKQTLTAEQLAIISTDRNLSINAVAGSGKTTTIVEFAASRPPDARILYLAFNKSVKLEAARKFSVRGLSNVKVETAHSLAYRFIMQDGKYKIQNPGYKTHEIAELLDLKVIGEKHTEFVVANHISKFISYFCNSDKSRIQDLNYLDTIHTAKAKLFVRSFYSQIEAGARKILAKMDTGEIGIIHDFYLKKFQLSNPSLDYDYILFDEGQDASAAMLDIFLRQKTVKLIVGDTHQQIYSWRHAVNSLIKTDFETLQLSASFRFRQDIADLAKAVLAWKNHLGPINPVSITGRGDNSEQKTKATIARSNLGLLVKAIDFSKNNRHAKHIYFEGNINSYTYADDGASLYDVLSLYNGNHDRIRDKLIRSMQTLDDLEDYIKKTEDVQLGMMVKIVKDYGNEIPSIIKNLKSLHTGDDEKHKAEMIFSTVHKAKGMEYDIVHLAGDFVTESKLEKAKAAATKDEPLQVNKWNEEINLLYVAITRAKNELYIPETLLPKDFPASPQIHLLKDKKKETDLTEHEILEDYLKRRMRSKWDRVYSRRREFEDKLREVKRDREIRRGPFKPWTPELDDELIELFDEEIPISEIAEKMERTKGAIIARLKRLGKFEE